MIDKYFDRPVLYDYCAAAITCGIVFFFFKNYISFPANNISISMSSEISTIALTLAGFVLTLLTVLITFRTGAKIPNKHNQEDLPLFDLFFATPLYFKTIDLLKNAIKSLLFIAVLGFVLKLILRDNNIHYLFFANVSGVVVILTTFSRCLLILTKIVDLQKDK